MRVGGATSQLDLPSLTPLYVACCGRLRQRPPHWATSVYCFSIKSIEDFTFFLMATCLTHLFKFLLFSACLLLLFIYLP